MPWVRIDDHFDEHPKIIAVGPLGMALWVAGLAYCNRNLTDGFIPELKAESLVHWRFFGPADKNGEKRPEHIMTGEYALDGHSSGCQVSSLDIIELLLEEGLWTRVRGGYQIHDYDQYQPTKEQVLAEREAKATAGRAGGLASAQARAQAKSKHVLEQNPSTASSKTQAKSKPVPGPVPGPDSLETIVSNGAIAPPSVRSYQGCLAALRGATNPAATMRDLLQELYGVPIPDKDIGRIGAGIKKVGAGKFFEVAWNAVKGWPGVDNPLDWIAGALKKVEADVKANGRIVDSSEMANGLNYAELTADPAHQEYIREKARAESAARKRDHLRAIDGTGHQDARDHSRIASLSSLSPGL